MYVTDSINKLNKLGDDETQPGPQKLQNLKVIDRTKTANATKDKAVKVVEEPVTKDYRKDVKQTKQNYKENVNLEQFAETENKTFHKNKLQLSGDIETNPGPKLQRNTVRVTLLFKIAILLLPIIILVIEMNEEKDQQKNQTIQHQSLNSIGIRLNLKYKKLKTPPRIKSMKSYYLVILLILAGDVKVNPGPSEEINASNSTVVCETCHQSYHLQSTTGNNLRKMTETQSFEWICPNPSCKPNHSPMKPPDSNTAPNRYSILENDSSKSDKVNEQNNKGKKKSV